MPEEERWALFPQTHVVALFWPDLSSTSFLFLLLNTLYFGGAGSSLRCVALASCGAQAQLPCGMCGLSSSTRDWTHIPHTGRQILNHWTTREVPSLLSPSQTFLSLLSHLSVNGTATESNWRYDISSMGRRPAIGQHQWGSPKRTGHAGLAQNPTWILKAISHRRKQTVRTGLAFKFFKKLINQPIN